jgi:hypothetical protein
MPVIVTAPEFNKARNVSVALSPSASSDAQR